MRKCFCVNVYKYRVLLFDAKRVLSVLEPELSETNPLSFYIYIINEKRNIK